MKKKYIKKIILVLAISLIISIVYDYNKYESIIRPKFHSAINLINIFPKYNVNKFKDDLLNHKYELEQIALYLKDNKGSYFIINDEIYLDLKKITLDNNTIRSAFIHMTSIHDYGTYYQSDSTHILFTVRGSRRGYVQGLCYSSDNSSPGTNSYEKLENNWFYFVDE